MTDQEINVALAELRGWKKGPPDGFDYGTMFPYSWWKNGVGYSDCPDHLNGIEALGHLHEAEKELIPAERIEAYMNRLADACPGYTRDRFGYWPMVCARPRERAIAILRTVGKYRETAAQ